MKASEPSTGPAKDAQAEVSAFLELIANRGITIEELIASTPDSWKDREKAKNLASSLANDSELMTCLRESREPLSRQSLEQLGLNHSLFQRYAAYITAVALIMNDQFPILGDMVIPWVKGDV
ncbi:MAG: hypothetical protein GXY50_02545 [Syntrophomonadaceae bacterium]|nr:hypothetical protein [Syntrophomonadaceae bacterium]